MVFWVGGGWELLYCCWLMEEFSMERVYLNRKEHTVLRNNTFS